MANSALTPNVERTQSAAAETRLDSSPVLDKLPSFRGDKALANLPALNDASLRQVTLRPPADLDTVEIVRCFQSIEQMLGNQSSSIVQLAMPTSSASTNDVAYSLAWAGAVLLGRRVLLIDAEQLELRSGPGSPDKSRGASAGQIGKSRSVARVKAEKQQLVARWPIIDQLQQLERLSDVVAGKARVEDAIIKEASSHLFVAKLDAEAAPGRSILAPRDIKVLLDGLRAHFDMILVTPSPVLTKPLATILTGIVDGTVLVMQAEKSRRGTVERAIQALQSGGAPILGVIFAQHQNYLPKWLRWFRSR